VYTAFARNKIPDLDLDQTDESRPSRRLVDYFGKSSSQIIILGR
jgi:hypothetical protein